MAGTARAGGLSRAARRDRHPDRAAHRGRPVAILTQLDVGFDAVLAAVARDGEEHALLQAPQDVHQDVHRAIAGVLGELAYKEATVGLSRKSQLGSSHEPCEQLFGGLTKRERADPTASGSRCTGSTRLL